MYKLDFLSGAPKTFIFARDSNKTNLGGIFTLIYLILTLLIAYISIYFYIKKQNYSVVYTYEEEYLNINSDKHTNKLTNEKLNPEITYKFEMDLNVDKSKFYAIAYKNPNDSFKFGEERKFKVYDFGLFIWYNCEKLGDDNYDCSLRKNDSSLVYLFSLNCAGFKTDRQNEESPLLNNYISENFYFTVDEKITYFFQKWKTIKYKDNNKNKEYYGGAIINDKMAIMDIPDYWQNSYKNNRRLLCIIVISYSWVNYYDNYSRSKDTIIEPISYICSLSMTIYSIFNFIYCGFFPIVSIIIWLLKNCYSKKKGRFLKIKKIIKKIK